MPSTWTSKAMWKAVFYVLVLKSLGDIASHVLFKKAITDLIPKEIFDSPDHQTDEDHIFYLKSLPRGTLFTLLTTPVNYVWLCWLERMLPARPLRVSTPRWQAAEEEPIDLDSNDGLEEAMMRQSTTKGKLQRYSISWFNTVLKWMFDYAIGVLFYITMHALFDGCIDMIPPSKIWATWKMAMVEIPIMRLLSINTLVALLSFATIPVQHRLPFENAVQLAWMVFVGALLNAVLPWFNAKGFLHVTIQNATEATNASDSMISTAVEGSWAIDTAL